MEKLNKTNIKKCAAALLAVTVAMGAFAGCSESAQTPQSSENNSSQVGESPGYFEDSETSKTLEDNSSQVDNLQSSHNSRVANKDDFTFNFTDDKKSYIASYYLPKSGKGAEIYNIPSEYEGFNVVAIADESYKLNDNVIEVNIPDSVKKIGRNSFAFCENLETVNMGNGVTIIKDGAFMCCSDLKILTLSENLKEIGASAFNACESLQRVTLPDGVTTIKESAFGGCTSLEEAHIPASVTEMKGTGQSGVFANSDKVTIYAPAGSYAEQYAKDNGIPFVAE